MARRPAAYDLINSRRVPRDPGPTPHAVRVQDPGATLYVSALLPRELRSQKMSTGDIRTQAELCFAHLRSVLQDSGFALEELVRCRIDVTELRTMDRVDEIWRKMFVGQMLPARTVTQVAALPEDARIQVEAVAVKAANAAPAAPEPPPPYYDEGEPY